MLEFIAVNSKKQKTNLLNVIKTLAHLTNQIQLSKLTAKIVKDLQGLDTKSK